MTVSELARNAGFGTSASDKPPFLESVLSDFKGLRRHFRVSRIAHIGLNTLYTCYNPSYTHKRAAAPSVDGEIKRPRPAHASRAVDPAWLRSSPRHRRGSTALRSGLGAPRRQRPESEHARACGQSPGTSDRCRGRR